MRKILDEQLAQLVEGAETDRIRVVKAN